MDEWDESKHPRAENGQFGNGNGNKKVNTEEKIRKVKIDFSKDNILPELNEEDLEELAVESKPILASKRMLDRNKIAHPDISEEEYNTLLGNSLYNPQYIFPANPDKPDYFHFISNIDDGKNSGVILELAKTKDNFEVVHIQKLRNKSVERIKKRDGNKS